MRVDAFRQRITFCRRLIRPFSAAKFYAGLPRPSSAQDSQNPELLKQSTRLTRFNPQHLELSSKSLHILDYRGLNWANLTALPRSSIHWETGHENDQGARTHRS